MSNFPHGFANGVTIRGLPLTMVNPGKVVWVNNSGVLPDGSRSPSNGNTGSYLQALSTINSAVGKCTANRGDVIAVMPGHAETISNATTLLLNKAGVTIIGLGTGTKRPTLTFDTATTASIPVSADNIAIMNCVFKANFAAVVAPFTLTTAAHFALYNCEFRDISAILNFKYVVNVGATSNAADGLQIETCKRVGAGATSGTALVNMAGTNDRIVIRNNYVAHLAVTDAGLMPIATGKVVTNAIIDSNVLNFVGATSATTGTLITTDGTTNSGVICKNLIKSLDDTSPILVTASSGFIFSQNFYQANADKSGFLLPALDT